MNIEYSNNSTEPDIEDVNEVTKKHLYSVTFYKIFNILNVDYNIKKLRFLRTNIL